MDEIFEIHYKILAERLSQVSNLSAFGQEHGLANVREAFKVMDLFPPNSGQGNCRNALRALGFEFGDGQGVRISYEESPLVN